jgi:hypothetical protein
VEETSAEAEAILAAVGGALAAVEHREIGKKSNSLQA